MRKLISATLFKGNLLILIWDDGTTESEHGVPALNLWSWVGITMGRLVAIDNSFNNYSE